MSEEVQKLSVGRIVHYYPIVHSPLPGFTYFPFPAVVSVTSDGMVGDLSVFTNVEETPIEIKRNVHHKSMVAAGDYWEWPPKV